MDRRWVGESMPLRAAFTDEAGAPMAGVTGVTFVLELENGTSAHEVPGVAASPAHVFTAWVTVPGLGVWEVQARCTGPVVAFSRKVRFQAVDPLDFAP